MKISNMKIGARLGMGFGIVLLLLLGITGMGLISLGQLHDGTDRLVKVEWVKSKLASQALDNVRGSIGRVFQIVAISEDRKSTRLNSSHQIISYAVFCLK